MYQALYRKWRSRTFDEVVGQEHVTGTLKRQVASGRLSHAYLFTGTRGTGKTSCAKLLARAVNCEHPVDGNPCNQCPACLGIENGSILDVLELDAASNNRVDDIRAILDEAAYTPASVKKRVYIVDEVHMLSAQAFNALLQILEEPPEHLMFILATTEIHKVPATIKSRCQQFAFKRIRPEAIAQHLRHVAQAEGLTLTAEGAALLARLANGGMRDALSLLDQCAGEHSHVGEGEILETLGLAGNVEAAGLLEAVARGEKEDALARLDRLYAGGKEMSALLNELSALVRDLLIRNTAPHAGESLLTGGFDTATLKRLGELLNTPRLVWMLNLLQRTAADLTRSPNRRTDMELCLVTLSDPALDSSPAGLSARIAELEERLRSGAVMAPTRSDVSVPPAEETGEAPARAGDPPPWARDGTPSAARPAGSGERETPAASPSPPQENVAACPSGPAVRSSWSALRARLETVMNIADFCFVGNPEMVAGSLGDHEVTLWVQSDFVKGFIDKPDILALVAQTAEELTGSPCRVQVKVGQAPPEGTEEPRDELDDFLGMENVTTT